MRGNVDVLMKTDEMTIGKLMKNAGYKTACIGKWGIGHPPPPSDPHDNGFDYFFGYLSMWHAHNYYPEFLWKNGEKVQLRNIGNHVEKHYKDGQEELTHEERAIGSEDPGQDKRGNAIHPPDRDHQLVQRHDENDERNHHGAQI